MAANSPATGLRERKKGKTRAAIREHAALLFREQGYEETTVEQIAEAAEVSPSTYFRYFPTKESVVFDDDYDAQIVAEFAEQPSDLSPAKALGAAMRAVTDRLSVQEKTALRERNKLVWSVPVLRSAVGAHLDEVFVSVREVAAQRAGADPDDFSVHVFAAAMQGIWTAVFFRWGDRKLTEMVDVMVQAMDHAEDGLPITPATRRNRRRTRA